MVGFLGTFHRFLMGHFSLGKGRLVGAGIGIRCFQGMRVERKGESPQEKEGAL